MTSRHKSIADPPKRSTYRHAFVETLPEKLDEGVLYVCIKYSTSAHNCFCGCRREVVTPIHPTKWKLTFDGLNVSLSPSIGSWSLACRSHYWLQSGRVEWAETWSDEDIQAAQSRDLTAQERYFAQGYTAQQQDHSPQERTDASRPSSFWRDLAKWLQGE